MAHTLIVGGQPDWQSMLDGNGEVFAWNNHGREIASGDAEKTLDLTPSTSYRAASSGSGELAYFHRAYTPTLSRGIGGIVHNLADIGGKTRYVVSTSEVWTQVMPTETVKVSNAEGSVSAIAAVFGDVDQSPFGSITTYATPTTVTSDWYLEVGFDNATALYTGVDDSQEVLVYLRAKGSHSSQDTQQVLIEVKEDDGSIDANDFPVRASKNLRIRAEADDTFVVAVLVDPADFDDPTLDDMTVRVTCEGMGPSPNYWQVGSIVWLREVSSGVAIDSGWIDVESTVNDLASIGDAQICSIHPLLDGDGEVDEQTGAYTYFLLYWDDSIDIKSSGRSRIFLPDSSVEKSGVPTNWRPEIGVIAEGPAYGTNTLSFGYTPSWTDPSIVRESKGGNIWTIRRESRRRVSLTLDPVSAADYAGELFSVMRRCGMSRPFLVCIKPSPAFNNAVSQAVSIYGRLVSFDSSNYTITSAAPGDGVWRVTMVFEELL